MFVSQVV